MTTSQPAIHEVQQFFDLLRSSLGDGAFVRLILGKYRGDDPGLQRVMVQAVTIKDESRLSFVYRYERKDIAKNFPIPAGFEAIHDLIASGFRSAHLFTLAENILLESNKKGEPKLIRSKATQKATPATAHNREKTRLIDPAAPFLWELGVTNSDHQVLPSMSRKWKQINVFMEIFQGAFASSALPKAESVQVVDFGSGKGYLTFAVYDYLCGIIGAKAQVTGIEERAELVQFCNETAKKTGMTNLNFSQGDVVSYAAGQETPVAPPAPSAAAPFAIRNSQFAISIDVMIALHACDTATDLAIHQGIRAGAAIILCAPCCHKELRPQMKNPEVLQPLLRFGIQQAQEAEMLTDSMRALLLEASGYDAQIFEFVSPEHTAKNKMILAVKRTGASRRETALAQLRALKEFYGIQEQCLEKLLSSTNFTN